MKAPRHTWLATRHFEPRNPNRNNPNALAGVEFDIKADALAFARSENRWHHSGYVVLKKGGAK